MDGMSLGTIDSFSQLVECAGFYVAAMLVCAAGIFYTLMHNIQDKRHGKLLLWLLINILLSAGANFTKTLAEPFVNVSQTAFAVFAVSRYLFFMLHCMLAPSFFLYAINLTGLNFGKNISRNLMTLIPGALILIMAAVNPFTGWIYTFTKEHGYQRSAGMAVPYTVSGLYFLAAAVILFVFWRILSRRRKIVMVFFYLMISAGIIIELVLNIHTELFMESLGLVGIMVTIGSEEDLIDFRYGVYNLAALDYHLRVFNSIHKEFCLIILKVLNPSMMLRFGGSAGVGAVAPRTIEYLSTIVPRKSIYSSTPGTFAIISENTDYQFNLSLARTIKERFEHSWKLAERDIKYNSSVMCVNFPGDFSAVDDILLLVNSTVPDKEGLNDDILYGENLHFIVRQSMIDEAIVHGLDNRKFEVYYQPIYSAPDSTICFVEALVRLHDEEFGDVYPNDFLPVAERNGMINDIGDYVLNEVCSFLNSGIPTEMGITGVGINLSTSQCMHPVIADRIIGIVSKYALEPSKIIFEIKETDALTDYDMMKQFITKLKEYGFGFSIDNFGIGFSNLSLMFTLDIGIVKLDKTMLWEAEKSNVGRIVMENTISMIKQLGRRILISGIETKEQIDLAQAFEPDYLQGYYFSNALSQNELISILKATQLAKFEEQKALAASEAMSNFLASMSHEIRTPINAVLGMDEMILRECDDANILQYAQNIEGAGRTLLSLINDILDLSKLEAGNFEIVEGAYEISSLISDVENMIKVKSEAKGLQLICEVDPSTPEKLYGDETRIRQILLNLMNNAVKYTDEGSVTLKTAYEKTGKDTIKLMFSISDTGIGIKEEDMSKLFDKFRRLDTEKNKSVEGSGLGLAITSQLIRNMNGAIDVKSVYGSGSTFYVIIPQKVLSRTAVGGFREGPVKNEGRKRHANTERFHAPDAKILIVDDTPMNIAVVEALLRRIKVQTDRAGGGAECLEKLKYNIYDVILLDYRMPEMDGIEVLKRIRQLEDNPNQKIPVIALTANAISGAREKFLAEGFDDYITKPVDGTRLEKMLMVYLPAGKIKLNASPEPEDIGAGEDAETASSGNGDGTVNATDAGGKAGVKDSGSCIDYDAGIANCGSEEIYRSILQIFIDDIDNKTSAIRQSLENNDIKRYTVEVHALKSSARTVGAMEVSKLAAELEDAGERSDMERINADTERLLTMFAGCRSAAKGLDIFNSAEAGQTAGKREKAQSGMSETIANEIGRDVWKDALETIKEFAQLMDYDNAAMILGSLRDYDMSDDNKKHITELRNLVDGLKWENVIEKIDGILSEM